MYYIRAFFTAVILAAFIIIVSPSALAAESLSVAVNQSRVLHFSGVQRVAIANPDIADVLVVSGSEVLLLGKAPGATTFHVWSYAGRSSYLVEVAADDAPIANEIRAILGYENIRVSKVGKTIILEGKVSDQYQKGRAEAVAGAYGNKVVNLLELTKPVQVKIEAKIVEIDRAKEKKLGINWSAADAPGMFSFGQSAINKTASKAFGSLGTYSEINAELKALIKNGAAKILSQPNVITLSGDKADILVGGQIPVPVSVQNGQIAIEWKDYGIKLEVAPMVNAEGLINSKIKAEVSSLDWDSGKSIELGNNMKIPPIKSSQAETSIALSSGQTMAIGGLISSQATRDITKVPLLGDLPVIGNLFKSTAFNKNETELIILITPSIVDPADYIPQATQEMQDFIQEDPWGGTNDGREDKGTNR
ncbi:MAG: BON domain-containing protein [Veillonellaceae bacterium]|jgi:pilus assembly protein CpaC|nr:BON domain-containing protein [Veillonellaceae bacterium]